MASQGSKGVTGKVEQGIMTRLSESKLAETAKGFVYNTSSIAKKVVKSTGKMAWVVGMSSLILVLPLIIVLNEEHQLEYDDAAAASILVGQ